MLDIWMTFFIVVSNRDKAREVLKLARLFVGERLNLKLNERKSQIFPLAQGVNGIGFKTFTTHILLKDDSKVRIKRRAQSFPTLILGDPAVTHKASMSIETAEQMLNSWKSHADFACSKNFILDLIANNPYLYLISNGERELFRINEYKLKLTYEST